MVYGIKDAPRDKYLWCTGYRFDKTKAGINCNLVMGKSRIRMMVIAFLL